METRIIVAVSEKGVIGRDNDLPWRLPDDMKFFRETTTGHPVIMGSRNWFSIPEKFRPLPNRTNIVLSRQSSLVGNEVFDGVNTNEAARRIEEEGLTYLRGAIVSRDLTDALALCRDGNPNVYYGNETVYIVGGGEIYRQALELGLVDTVLLTRVHAHIVGTVFFPELSPNEWTFVSSQHHAQDEKHTYAFTWERYERAR